MYISLLKLCPLNKHRVGTSIHNRKSNYPNLHGHQKLPLREVDRMKQPIMDPVQGKVTNFLRHTLSI